MRPLEGQAGPSNWAQSPTLKRRRSESHSSSSPSSPEIKGGTQKRPFLRARTQTPTNFRLANEEQGAQLLVASPHHSPNRHARILLRHDSASNTVYAHYDDQASSSSSVESDRGRMSAAAAAVAALGTGMDEDVDANGTGSRGQQALSAAFLQPAPSEHWTRHSMAGPEFLSEQLGEPAARGYVPSGDAMDEDVPPTLTPPSAPFARWSSESTLPQSPIRKSGSSMHSHTPIRPSPLGDGGGDRRRSLHDAEVGRSPISPAFQTLRSPASIPKRSLSTGWATGAPRAAYHAASHAQRPVSQSEADIGMVESAWMDSAGGMHMDTGQGEAEPDRGAMQREWATSSSSSGRQTPVQRPPSPFLVREDAQAAVREHARRGSLSMADRPSMLSHPRWKHLAPSPPLSP
ncbi:hypothetical protein CBOM_06939 [Ceraceosorus bombacis]|uniref:Uncharacterized protein n=1 Tax=Ceraceosorus bombacis TaxID=401625 RepID=A0A0P1BL87_9BASI|nr:hypothetical protein CBOM_06939 [Ceraceosorus bombacis]